MKPYIAKKISDIYYTPSHPASFSNVRKLWLATDKKISKKLITEWLMTQDTYTLHKPRRLRFRRNCYKLNNIAELWEIDLAQFSDDYASHNEGVKYLLVVIDCFSKYMFVEPLKRKTPESVIAAFKKIFARTTLRPQRCQSDSGSEFIAGKFKKFLKDNDIIFNTTLNPDTKAGCVERSIRTLKNKIYKYLTHVNSFTFIDKLDDIVKSYNHGYHSTIKMAPNDVTDRNILQVYKNIQSSQVKARRRSKKKQKKLSKIKVGDYVRITKGKKAFTKGYLPCFSEEVFVVKTVIYRDPVVYRIEDLEGEEIKGTFYEPEIQKVIFDPTAARAIDSIIKQKGKGKNLQYLVKWRGYNHPKFNSWIAASAITSI